MGRRVYKRLQAALPVTISGLDTNGNPFKQTATTIDIGPKGMRLRDVYCLRGRGNPVKVEHRGVRADFRVAWIDEIQGSVGLEGLEDAQFLFARNLPPDFKTVPDRRLDGFAVPGEGGPVSPERAASTPERRLQERRQAERRRYQRYHCAGMARIFEGGMQRPSSHRINEISMGGCYIAMMSPLPIGCCVIVDLELNRRSIRVEATIKSSQTAYGMGAQFTAMEPAEQEKLAQVIAEVSGKVPLWYVEPEATSAAPPVEPLPAKEVGEAVERWFGIRETLSRADFFKLVEELKSVTH